VRIRALPVIATVAFAVGACSSAAPASPSAALPTLAGPSSAPPTVALSSVVPSAAPTSAAPSVAATSAAPSASEAPSAIAEPSASEEPSVAASVAAEPSIPTIADIEKNLSHLNSYVETFMQTGGTRDISAKVTVVRQPKLEEELDLGEGSKAERLIVIGTDTCVDTGSGKFLKNAEPATVMQASFDAFDPGVFLKSFEALVDLTTVPVVGTETKNGVQALHIHADQNTKLKSATATIPPGAQFDLWLSTDNDYLVALEYSGVPNGGKIQAGSIELTNINDSSLSVQAPS